MLPFANPLANLKTEKRLKKMIKEAKDGDGFCRGRKACLKAIDSGRKGILFISGDISPMDLVSHLPYYCEKAKIPYVFVRKNILREASDKKNLTTCVFVDKNNKSENYKKILKFVGKTGYNMSVKN